MNLCDIDTVCCSNWCNCTLSMLSRQPLCESAICSPCCCCATHFKWARCNALVYVATLHYNFATFEVCVAGVVGQSENHGVEYNVASACVKNEVRACHCLFKVNVCFENVVIDDDCFCSVFTLFTSLCNNCNDWLANITNFVDSKKCARCHWVVCRGHWLKAKICAAVDGNDAWHQECVGIINSGDESVRY